MHRFLSAGQQALRTFAAHCRVSFQFASRTT
jgi:hypothetical protein